MRVALLTDGIFPYVIGGMQKHSFYLAKYFALNQIHVDLYHTSKDPVNADRLDCFSLEEREYISSYAFGFPVKDHFPGHYIREMYAYSSILFNKLKENPPVDFIYVQGLCGMKLFENRIQIATPTGVNFHGLEMFQKAANLRSKLEQFLFRRPVLKSLKNAEVVFSLGGKLTDLLIQQGIPKEKISEVSIGIDSSWINSGLKRTHSGKRTFVFIGRYERRKGIEELLYVLNKIVVTDFQFHFIGAIPDEKKINRANLHFWGNISDPEKIKAVLKEADVLVCPSYSEGMPTVILEAMASGLAIIASDVGAVSEQVSAENGILVRPGNTDDLENAINKMLQIDTLILNRMKEHSVDVIRQQFLWEAIIARNISEIQKTL
ncbi:MAG TPA: glycosyltransferase family 4 protein [Bacteroidia bacterium]|jgi:glycosyltransferase involved in cell wall biosynthesis